jgi:hypothetical protein
LKVLPVGVRKVTLNDWVTSGVSETMKRVTI